MTNDEPVRFDPPRCARYGCENLVSRERWLWGKSNVAMTCSSRCASLLGAKARPTWSAPEIIRRCAREGCLNTISRENEAYCSHKCAARAQFGEELGPTLHIAPPPPPDEVEWPGQCGRPGCTNAVAKKSARYCSHKCSSIQTGGDRWEKRAPKMVYTEAIREQMIREIYQQEVERVH